MDSGSLNTTVPMRMTRSIMTTVISDVVITPATVPVPEFRCPDSSETNFVVVAAIAGLIARESPDAASAMTRSP